MVGAGVGFRLPYLGYDFLAIKTMVNYGVFSVVGRQIGVRKESDIFEVSTEDGRILAMKLHRLGRISFRAVKSKRDYLMHRSSYNWLYLSRLAAIKEYAFMKIDVDIGSSTMANGVLGLVFGVTTTLVVDIAFFVQGNSFDELPERLIGDVRVSHIELSSAVVPVLDNKPKAE